jgi:hypothetical protein
MRVANIVIDCANPAAVGEFWSATFSGALETHIPNAFLSMKTPEGGSWFFLRVPEPKTAKNRMHVDLDSGGSREAEVSRLVGLGATLVAEKDEWGHRWTVLQDPEGNEFCVS